MKRFSFAIAAVFAFVGVFGAFASSSATAQDATPGLLDTSDPESVAARQVLTREKFPNLAALTDRFLAEEKFDSFAIIVGFEGSEYVLTSANVDMDTFFDVASTGKILVTAPLALQAVDRGLLSLDDTLDKFFENVPEDKRKITVRQLLTHTSGILRYNISAETAAHNHDYIAAEILSRPLAFEPGTNYVYSCVGMMLVGYILEKVYPGKTLDEIFYLNIKNPLEMKRAGFNIALDEKNAAICRRWNDPKRLRVMDDEIVSVVRNGVAGNGGGFMSPDSYLKFVRAVMNYDSRLYSREMFELAERNYAPEKSSLGRGLGYVYVDEREKQTGKLFPKGSFGHTGHAGQSVFMNRETELYVIVLTNATRFANKKNNFQGYNYAEIEAMRATIHNAIHRDLTE